MKNLKVFKNRYLLIIILLFLIFSLFFSVAAINRYNHFGSWAWDLGLYDQGIWLIKNGEPLFNTVRGLHQFGDHVTFINYLVAPIFFIKEDVRLLLIFQTLWIFSTIFPIYLLSKKFFKKEHIGIMLAISFLLYPAIQYVIIEDFHPETLAIPFIIWIFYFAENKNWVFTILFSVLTILIKEDFAVSIFLIGIFILFKYNKKVGILISSISLAWFVLVMTFLLKFFNGIGYYKYLYGWNIFGSIGSGFFDIIKNIIIQPIKIIKLIFVYKNFDYIIKIFLPLSFLPLLSGFFVLVWLPLLFINLIGSDYMRSITYHYVIPLTPLLFVSLIFTLKKYKKYSLWLSLIILILSIGSNIAYGPDYSSIKKFPKNLKVFKEVNSFSDQEQKVYTFISQIPDNAKVSATYLYVSHLTHRKYIYMFPNPFKLAYWGIAGENPPEKDIDYILVDKKLISQDEKDLLNQLIADKKFVVIDEVDETIFLKKSSAYSNQ